MEKIGIDSRLTYYRTGGISTYIRALISALASLHPIDAAYTVFHSRKEANPAHIRADHVRYVPLWTPAHHKIERLALSVELARFRLDVFHSPDFIPPYRAAKRHIITVHDLTFLHYPQYLTAESRRYYNDQIEAAVHHADHILTVSESARDDLIAMLNVSPHKITVQPHGVNHQRFRPLPTDAIKPVLQRYGLTQPGYLLFVGTLEPRKNIDGLLTAYAQLQTRLPTAPPLVLVGRQGWLIEKTLERLHTLKNIYWIQDATDDDLPALYTGAKALVLPSFYEGFGMPALEAMACGTLPIISDCSSLPEVTGDLGLKVDPHDPQTITDALYTLLNADDEWYATQQTAAIQQAATYTWARSAQIARAVYKGTSNL